MRLSGKVAVVTGAAQGIGRGYAETLAREGARVVLADVKHAEAERGAVAIREAGGEAIAVAVDIADPGSTRQLARDTADAFGRIDVLVNNAALYEGYVHYALMELPRAEWQRFLDVNLTGTLLTTQAVVPYMREQGKGKIVNQSSAGADAPHNQYTVTKLGVQGLTIAFARSLAKHGITVNCIAPGFTDTEATRGHYTQEQIDEIVPQRMLLGRIGTVQDVANALLFLASDESDFVTGQILHVDGGFVLHPA